MRSALRRRGKPESEPREAEQPVEQPEPPVLTGSGPAVLRRPELLHLQRTAGNAAVSTLLDGVSPERRRKPCGECGSASRSALREARVQRTFAETVEAMWDPASMAAKRIFQRSGVKGPRNLRAPTGIGGFSAQYDPRSEELKIRLTGGINFVDGMTLRGGRAVPNQPTGAAQTAANQINALPPRDRAARVAEWQWGNDKEAWIAKFQTRIQDAWSEQYKFHIERRRWEDIEANVRVEVAVHEGAKRRNENMSMTVYKVPEQFVGGVGVVNSGSGGFLGMNAATDNTMTLNSNDVDPRRDNLLEYGVAFTSGQTTLSADNRNAVQSVAATFKAGRTSCATCGAQISGVQGPVLTVKCQGDGATPDTIAQGRFDAIKQALADGGFTNPDQRTRFEFAGEGQNCTLSADSGAAQVVAAHEAGHMFGLGDEYATGTGSMITGTGAGAGTGARHDELSREMGLGGSVHENNDNIMSLGNVVRPQHYSTFQWALREVTAIDEWQMGAGRKVGDFPIPGRDGPPQPTAVA